MPTDQFYSDLQAWMEANGISIELLAKKCFETPENFQRMLDQKTLTDGIRQVIDYLMNRNEAETASPVCSTVRLDGENAEKLKILAGDKNISQEELLSKFVNKYFDV